VKVSGSHRLDVSRQAVWDALQDPAVLARTIPGCQSLEVTGPDAYAATLTAGVASVKGTYRGTVALADKTAPESYRLTAQGAGGPGTIHADATVRLVEDGGGTVVHYDADAVVGGMIGGVGQRMLQGVAKKTAGEFFGAIEHDLLHGPVAVPAVAAGPVPAGAVAAAPTVGEVFHREPVAPAAGVDRRMLELVGAVAVGAAIALAGVLVGRRLARTGPR
jgi:uncharacterized protein